MLRASSLRVFWLQSRGPTVKAACMLKKSMKRGEHVFVLILLGIPCCLHYQFSSFLLHPGDRNARSILVDVICAMLQSALSAHVVTFLPKHGPREAERHAGTWLWWLNMQSLLLHSLNLWTLHHFLYNHYYVDKIKQLVGERAWSVWQTNPKG